MTRAIDKWTKRKNYWYSKHWVIGSMATTEKGYGSSRQVVIQGHLVERKTREVYVWSFTPRDGIVAFGEGAPPRGGPQYVIDKIEDFSMRFLKDNGTSTQPAVDGSGDDLYCPNCEVAINTRPAYECDDQEMVCLKCGKPYLLSAQKVEYWTYSTRAINE